jgi:hypothetical protein
MPGFFVWRQVRSPDEAKRNPGLLGALTKIAVICTAVSTPIEWQYTGTDVSVQ